jgi:hypothetical protein
MITALLVSYQVLSAQQDGNKNEAESLVLRWNNAHNTHDASMLKEVYDSNVIVDGQQYSNTSAIDLKRNLFRAHPDYRQKITSDLRYKIYPENLIRCDFKKEMRKDGALWKYPAYVLITNINNQYLIVGESDDASDRTLNVYLKLSAAKNILASEGSVKNDTTPDVSAADSVIAGNPEVSPSITQSTADTQLLQSRDTVSEADTPLPIFAQEESVTIPVQYIYIFIGILVIGSILVLLMGARSRKKAAKVPFRKMDEQHDHYDKEQSDVFEKFVMSLFDPLYFRAFRSRQQKVLDSGSGEVDAYPELEFEFNNKEESARFIVESIYIKELQHRDIEIATPQQIRAFRQLDEDDHDLYLVVGMEGRPDDPKEIYLIPVKNITSPFITYPELQAYRKYGMFFYNAENKKLQ